ncbi:MAG: hypothetical protein ACR2HS_01270 [Gammaproteobacteria bacterium]
MISDTDIKDWVMLTTPLKLKELKEGEFFSFYEDNRVFKVMRKVNQIVYAETAEIFNAFALPDVIGVYKWDKKH